MEFDTGEAKAQQLESLSHDIQCTCTAIELRFEHANSVLYIIRQALPS